MTTINLALDELAKLIRGTDEPLADDVHAKTGELNPCPYDIGATYFIRTVTMSLTGVLVRVYPQELVLTDAAWIADTGRFADAVASGDFNDVEPFPAGRQVIVGRGSIIDAVQIDKLPREQK